MEENYYADSLNAQKLYQVYQTNHPRVLRYLGAEISFVSDHLQGTERVLELGAGYGRIMKKLAPACQSIVGIDISPGTVAFGQDYLLDTPNAQLVVMDAHHLHFDQPFDVILCLQNGLSAMRTEPVTFINRVMHHLQRGGKAFFSSYSAKFWTHRLAWFQEQSAKGLLGEIDMAQTGGGVIRCKDGFQATTHTAEDMERFGRASGFAYQVTEVDESSIFLVLRKE